MQERVHHKLGLLLIIVSCLMWVIVIFVPILPLSIAQKAILTPILVVISEAIFWLGILLSGKEFARRYRQKLSPAHWWRKVGRKRD